MDLHFVLANNVSEIIGGNARVWQVLFFFSAWGTAQAIDLGCTFVVGACMKAAHFRGLTCQPYVFLRLIFFVKLVPVLSELEKKNACPLKTDLSKLLAH
jgi:hypothetical protein